MDQLTQKTNKNLNTEGKEVADDISTAAVPGLKAPEEKMSTESGGDDLSSSSELEKRKRKRKRIGRGSPILEEQCISLMDAIKKERSELESFLMTEGNKISKVSIRQIMSKWAYLEGRLYETLIENQKLQAELAAKKVCLTQVQTYAQVASAGTSRVPAVASAQKPGPKFNRVAEPNNVLLIKPSKEGDKRTNDEIKRSMFRELGDKRSSIKVRNVRQMRKGGLIVELDGKEDVQILKSSTLAKVDLKVEEPKKLKPCVIIYDVESDSKSEELKEDLIKKNLRGRTEEQMACLEEKINFRHSFKTKSGRSNWLVEVPAKEYKELLDRGRAFLAWGAYRVREYFGVTRCYKCQGYGHIAKACSVTKPVCETCGEEGHMKADCKSKDKSRCINCMHVRKTADHSVRSGSCPVFCKQLEIYKSKIDWT